MSTKVISKLSDCAETNDDAIKAAIKKVVGKV